MSNAVEVRAAEIKFLQDRRAAQVHQISEIKAALTSGDVSCRTHFRRRNVLRLWSFHSNAKEREMVTTTTDKRETSTLRWKALRYMEQTASMSVR